jgi:hypothetical protein
MQALFEEWFVLTCDERRDLMLCYLTGVLEPAEAQDLRLHLAGGCPCCAGALAEAQATIAALPQALDPIMPSPATKQRLMDRIEPKERPVAGPIGPISPDRLPETAPLQLFRYFVPAAVAAGIAIVVTHALVMRGVAPALHAGDFAREMLVLEQQRSEQLQEMLKRQWQYVDMLRSPNLKMVQLDGAAQSSAVARIIWDQKTNDWLVLADGLTPPPPGKVYELWYIPAGANPVNAGTFTVDAKGRGTMMTKVPPNVGPFAVAAVTIENAGGSDTPTMPLQLASKASGT